MALSPNLSPLAALVGTWTGPGRGEYPTIEDFAYTEELTFTDVGKPFLAYRQRTWGPAGNPMHTETGFLRVPADGVVELTLAQPTGQVELAEGRLSLEAGVVLLDLTARLLNSATAKPVHETRRRYRLSGDELETDFAMEAAGQPLTHHLGSRLRRA